MAPKFKKWFQQHKKKNDHLPPHDEFVKALKRVPRLKGMVESLLDKKVLTPEGIAAKHKVPLERIMKALTAGIKIEHEHTSDAKAARRIALAHLGERPDYYSRLKKFVEGRWR